MTKKSQLWIVVILSTLLFNCQRNKSYERKAAELILTNNVKVHFDANNLLGRLGPPMTVVGNYAYVVDVRQFKVGKLNLDSGKYSLVTNRGKGPQEIQLPTQLTKLSDNSLLVYDLEDDLLAHLHEDTIIKKYSGYLEHGIWLRGAQGYFIHDKVYFGMSDPASLASKSYQSAKTIAAVDYINGVYEMKGVYPPTIDKLDSFNKAISITLDETDSTIYYTHSTDYTIWAYSIPKDSTFLHADYKPSYFKRRTMALRKDNLNRTEVHFEMTSTFTMHKFEDWLLVLHVNYDEKYFEEKDRKHLHLKGMLVHIKQPKYVSEIDLPGYILGVYNDQLVCIVNEDPDEYELGFYSLKTSLE